jgi:hypothetical protein
MIYYDYKYNHFRFPEVVSALALPDKDERRCEPYYIRTSLDNMRRVTMRRTDGGSVTEEEISYRLACYTNAIKELFANRGTFFFSNYQLIQFIIDIIEIINGGLPLARICGDVAAYKVDGALQQFAEELRQRLNEPTDYDPIETIALIEYRLRYARSFFRPVDRGVSEALSAFVLMRLGLRLPSYLGVVELASAAAFLPPNKRPLSAVEELAKAISTLRETAQFKVWVETIRAQFHERKREQIVFVRPSDPYKVPDITQFDYQSTCYDESLITRKRQDIDRLRAASGRSTENVVVFRPERMALQETIAAAVTNIWMEKPAEFLRDFVLSKRGLFHEKILPRVGKVLPKDRYIHVIKTFDSYIDYIIDDHFHIMNPHMESRKTLALARTSIIKQITKGVYNPRLAESRELLRTLVSDDLIRRHFQRQVRPIVDQEIDAFLAIKTGLRLQLKSNADRYTWVLAGGMASGKSTLERRIMREIHKISEPNRVCVINPDHYIFLLLEQLDDDPGYGSKTGAECDLIRDLALGRLETMIKNDRAPDFLMTTRAPVPLRMRLARAGGAKVNLYVVSCPVEGPAGAAQRALARANDPGSIDAFNRFISTRRLLDAHRSVSTELPKAISGGAGRLFDDLRIFNTASTPAILAASMDSHNRELQVFDPKGLIEFIRKSFLNTLATCESELYTGVDARRVTATLCDYHKAGVCFNFRYSAQVPDRNSERTELAADISKGPQAEESVSNLHGGTYMWIGHERAEIRDFETYANVFDHDICEALLIELVNRWPLTVRSYAGEVLLRVDSKKNVQQMHPNKPRDAKSRAMLHKAISTLHKESSK